MIKKTIIFIMSIAFVIGSQSFAFITDLDDSSSSSESSGWGLFDISSSSDDSSSSDSGWLFDLGSSSDEEEADTEDDYINWLLSDFIDEVEEEEETTSETEQTHWAADIATTSSQETPSQADDFVQEEQTHWTASSYVKPSLSISNSGWKKYLNIDWDTSSYDDAIVLISYNWTSFYTMAWWGSYELSNPWIYEVKFQIKSNGSYMTLHEETIENSDLGASILWAPKTWPWTNLLIAILLLSSLGYILYRRRFIK